MRTTDEQEVTPVEGAKPIITTIFSVTNCPYCTRAKSLLSSKGIPFVEINISKYPSKRADMLSLSDRLTVPQIFFGNTFIGGSDDLTSWLDKYPMEDISSFGIPTKEQLLLYPTTPEQNDDDDDRVVPIPRHLFDSFTALHDAVAPATTTTTSPYMQIALALEGSLALSTIDGYKKVTCKASLEACLMDWLGPNCKSIEEAIDELLLIHMIIRIRNASNQSKHSIVTNGKDILYRLHQHSQPLVLNSFRRWTQEATADPMKLAHQLKSTLDTLLVKYTNETDGLVDYISLSSDIDFFRWDEASCQLQGISLSSMNEKTRLAFVIMLYNIMIKHAFVKVGTPGVPVGPFFEHVKYNIGGLFFSFSDLENGILRGNRIPPGHAQPLFGYGDPRRDLSLSTVDPRIHFALNCGASSCPPIKKYTTDAIEEELRIVAMSYAESDDNIRLDEEHDTLYLNQIFNWYGPDFGRNSMEVARTLVGYLRGNKRQILERMLGKENGTNTINLSFLPYDWSTDSQIPRPFALEHFNMDP
jgi:glutaredoxin